MIGISTYLVREERLPIIKKSFDSLIKTTPTHKILVCDDGSPDKRAVEYIRGLGIEVIENEANKGYSKTKNRLIKEILDRGHDIGFLGDDDNIYQEGWEDQYREAIHKTGMDHWCLWLGLLTLDGTKQPSGDIVEKNGYKFRRTPLLNGCFMTFTRRMIEKIGYFPELKHKLGHEHSWFSMRAIHNGFADGYNDVVDPKVWNLQLIDENYIVSTEDAYNQENLMENGKVFLGDKSIYQPYHD